MKNLFTIPMKIKENEKLYFQNYEVKKISRETEIEIEKMNERITQFQKNYKHTFSKITSFTSFAFLLSLMLGLFQTSSENKTFMYVCFGISLISILLTVIFMYLDVKESKKIQESDEYKQLGIDGEATINKAYNELGLSKEKNNIDLYLHYYDEKDGKISNGLPYGAMMVKEYLISKDENNLILGDIFSVIKIPLTSIKGISKKENSYVFYGWNKKELPNSLGYKEYKIKSINNSMYFKTKSYYLLEMELEGKEAALYIAPYDVEKVKTLLNLD